MSLLSIGGFIAISALAILGFTGNLVRDSKNIQNKRELLSNQIVKTEKQSQELLYYSLNEKIFIYGWYSFAIGVVLFIIGFFTRLV